MSSFLFNGLQICILNRHDATTHRRQNERPDKANIPSLRFESTVCVKKLYFHFTSGQRIRCVRSIHISPILFIGHSHTQWGWQSLKICRNVRRFRETPFCVHWSQALAPHGGALSFRMEDLTRQTGRVSVAPWGRLYVITPFLYVLICYFNHQLIGKYFKQVLDSQRIYFSSYTNSNVLDIRK